LLLLTDDEGTDADDDDDDDKRVCKALVMSDDVWDFNASSDFSAKYSRTFFNTVLT